MATLSATITADATVIPVSGSAPEIGSYLTVGSESIRFLGTSRGPQGRSKSRSYWSVDRGVAGTTKATHSSGTTLTQYYPDAEDGGGSGGVNVDNGTDPPASVTTLSAIGALLAGDTATLPTVQLVVVSDGTGGTVTPNPGGSSDPTPVTSYTVVRDNLGAADDPSDYPVLPEGIYLVGGYVGFTVPDGTTGKMAASVAITSPEIPAGDNGPEPFIDLVNLGTIVPAPLKLVNVAGSVSNRKMHLKLIWPATGEPDDDVTWLFWVFYAIRLGS